MSQTRSASRGVTINLRADQRKRSLIDRAADGRRRVAVEFEGAAGAGGRDPSEAADRAEQERRYEIEILGAHSHIYKTVAIVYAVRDLGSCTDPKDLKTCKAVAGMTIRSSVRSVN